MRRPAWTRPRYRVVERRGGAVVPISRRYWTRRGAEFYIEKLIVRGFFFVPRSDLLGLSYQVQVLQLKSSTWRRS